MLDVIGVCYVEQPKAVAHARLLHACNHVQLVVARHAHELGVRVYVPAAQV
jgi:hypothetical protein